MTEEDMLDLVKTIDHKVVYEAILKLFDITWKHDVLLSMKKMEFFFMQKEPVDEEFNSYMECLAEAHTQMLFYLQDTNNKFIVMEADPVGSSDVMYGVPGLFKDILDEVTMRVEMLKNPEQYENTFQEQENQGKSFMDQFDQALAESHGMVRKVSDDDDEENFVRSMSMKQPRLGQS